MLQKIGLDIKKTLNKINLIEPTEESGVFLFKRDIYIDKNTR
jgi:hypothetical protein